MLSLKAENDISAISPYLSRPLIKLANISFEVVYSIDALEFFNY